MELEIVRKGNYGLLKLPEFVLEQYQINDRVELIFEEDYIILKPAKRPRAGWEEAFKEMHENGDDELCYHKLISSKSNKKKGEPSGSPFSIYSVAQEVL